MHPTVSKVDGIAPGGWVWVCRISSIPPHPATIHANMNFTVCFRPHPTALFIWENLPYHSNPSKSARIHPDSPRQTSFYELICAQMRAECASMRFDAGQCNRMRPHLPASGWTSRICDFCPMLPFIQAVQIRPYFLIPAAPTVWLRDNTATVKVVNTTTADSPSTATDQTSGGIRINLEKARCSIWHSRKRCEADQV